MKRFRRRKPEHESVRALRQARENLRETKERTTEVKEVAGALRLMRERNHFAETLQVIMEGSK